MSDTVIRVENLGKKYIISHQSEEQGSYKSLRESISNRAKSLGKNFFKSYSKEIYNPTREEFWALKNISFEIKNGERVGIIGHNGAGKSTLLKILSQITEPTTGCINIKGRIASLLEVGTGFHPELTGRENIYLNGAILGMSKAEIKHKFDEIVAFAEVEKFLDTPVKRYSSGMYVRLAFAVAAHLEPEILIVDEVLAVGDAQFQKKCLGKMQEVGKEGRTVLFVSHNMGAIQQLCTKSICLELGSLKHVGTTKNVIEEFLKINSTNVHNAFLRKGNKSVVFENFYLTDNNNIEKYNFFMGDTISVVFSIIVKKKVALLNISIEFKNYLNESFAHITNGDNNFFIENPDMNQKITMKVDIPNIFFTPSKYLISLWIGDALGDTCDYLIDCLSMELIQGDQIKRLSPYPSHVKVFLNSTWNYVS